MQRRAAAAYVAFFLVIAAGAYTLIGAAQQPTVELDAQSLSVNDTLTVDERTYTVSSVSEGSGELQWTNESARYTATWANNTTVAYQGTNYTVVIPNASDPSQFTLREVQNLSDGVSTVTENGTEFVITQNNGTRTLVPVEEYKRQQFGAPETRQFSEGDSVEYQGNQTTVGNITAEEVPFVWNAPQTNTVSVSDGANVELGPNGQTFVAHFPGDSALQLTQNTGEYQSQVDAIDRFNERIAGLWGITILSGLTVILLIGLAYLPVKS